MKVFLYIRVACADQLAAANQREELERYAKDKGYEVAAAVAADGISGVHTEDIMNFLLNEAKRQGIGKQCFQRGQLTRPARCRLLR